MDLRLPTPAGDLTRAEQKILDYINTNTDAFLFSSIGQLAERLEISDATVSRFARHVGCRDFKALKSLVMEQSPGPAAKLAATLSQGEGSLHRHGWSASSGIWRSRPSISPQKRSHRPWTPSARLGGYCCTGKTPQPRWRSCSTSACVGWGSPYPCCRREAPNCWRGWFWRAARIWWYSSASPSSPGRGAFSWSRADPPAIGRWPL